LFRAWLKGYADNPSGKNAERGQSLAQMALSWCLRDPAVTSVLIGASCVEQLQDNVKSLGSSPFTAVELAAIDKAATI